MWVWLAAALAAEPEWKPLFSEEATASSFLQSNWNKYTENYHPNYILDLNPKTAWVEGVDGDGEGQWLEIPVSSISSARAIKLKIWNGYQKSPKLLAANASPRDVIVQTRYRGANTGVVEASLAPTEGAQEVVIPVRGGVDAVRIQIMTVNSGRTYRDLCISDVEIFVDSSIAHNPAMEMAKQAKLQAWIGERMSTAKYFANQPPEYLFASGQFSWMAPDGSGGSLPIEALRTQLASTLETAPLRRADRKRAAPPLPDGLDLPPVLTAFLDTGEISWFEAADRSWKKIEQQTEYDAITTWNTPPQVIFDEQQRPAILALEVKQVSEGRASKETAMLKQLVVYKEGKPQQIYVQGTAEINDAELGRTYSVPKEEVVIFHYNGAGKIDRLESWYYLEDDGGRWVGQQWAAK